MPSGVPEIGRVDRIRVGHLVRVGPGLADEVVASLDACRREEAVERGVGRIIGGDAIGSLERVERARATERSVRVVDPRVEDRDLDALAPVTHGLDLRAPDVRHRGREVEGVVLHRCDRDDRPLLGKLREARGTNLQHHDVGRLAGPPEHAGCRVELRGPRDDARLLGARRLERRPLGGPSKIDVLDRGGCREADDDALLSGCRVQALVDLQRRGGLPREAHRRAELQLGDVVRERRRRPFHGSTATALPGSSAATSAPATNRPASLRTIRSLRPRCGVEPISASGWA